MGTLGLEGEQCHIQVPGELTAENLQMLRLPGVTG